MPWQQIAALLQTTFGFAIRTGAFRLAYQPIFDLSSMSICCFEALLRWPHPKRGPVSPEKFIPVAERTGLIATMGEWVLHEACREGGQMACRRARCGECIGRPVPSPWRPRTNCPFGARLFGPTSQPIGTRDYRECLDFRMPRRCLLACIVCEE